MSSSQSDERGFVLITAVWLLMLGAALVAAGMLIANHRSRAAHNQRAALQSELDSEAAVQTVAAELLIQGPTSRWSLLPANGEIDLGNARVQVEVTSEAGRIDFNTTDLAIIDRALLGLGLPAKRRVAFIQALAEARASGRVSSSADAEKILRLLEPRAGECLESLFTIASGLTTLASDRMPSQLVTALSIPVAEGPHTIRMGEPLRITVADGAKQQTVVGRIEPLSADPLSILQVTDGSRCQ